MSYSRVLIVDDYDLWRQYVHAALHRSSRWQCVGEASTAQQAVECARLFRPDLILLDVGLPGENGIQAARRILVENPAVKILFVSEHQSPELVEAALATGASGYIVKLNAGRDLLPAMAAVVDGRRFVSEHQSPELVEAALATGASGYIVKLNAGRDLLPAMAAVVDGRRFVSASLARSHFPSFHHAAGFYRDEAGLLDDYATFASGVL